MESTKTTNGNGLDAKTRALADKVLAQLKERGIDLEDANAKLEIKDIPFELISKVRAALATSKIPALLSVVEDYEEQDEPVVVFSDFLAPVEALGLRDGWTTITGETSSEERQKRVEAFQAGTLKGIAGTFGAMGVGLTLTRAHHVILNDLNWTPAINSQAEDRLCRIGQTRGVIVTHLVANHPLEVRIHELLFEKQRIIEASVERSAVGEDYTGSNPAEQLARAAESAKQQMVDMQAKAEADAVARVAAEAEQKKQAIAALADRGVKHDGRQIEVRGKTRSAANSVEEWSADGLVIVAGLDPDHASTRNGIGFSRFDNDFGHSVATQYRESGRLTERQWAAAVKMANKYRRQISESFLGPRPEVE